MPIALRRSLLAISPPTAAEEARGKRNTYIIWKVGHASSHAMPHAARVRGRGCQSRQWCCDNPSALVASVSFVYPLERQLWCRECVPVWCVIKMENHRARAACCMLLSSRDPPVGCSCDALLYSCPFRSRYNKRGPLVALPYHNKAVKKHRQRIYYQNWAAPRFKSVNSQGWPRPL